MYMACPDCNKAIIKVRRSPIPGGDITEYLAYPENISPRPIANEVPDPYRQDFGEAVAVFPLSPKASAALSRRNLQAVLRNCAAVKAGDLYNEIEEVIKSGRVPSHISEGLHAVRTIGNFAAHPIKSTSTGDIVEVEPGEAEWNLDVLESLFDFYFVEPAKTAKRKAELNAKLKAAGKAEIPWSR
jgi:hypothetical protein